MLKVIVLYVSDIERYVIVSTSAASERFSAILISPSFYLFFVVDTSFCSTFGLD